MHLPITFGADIFIQSGVIFIFLKLKMAAAAILDLFGWAMGPPTKRHSWCVPPVKISSWSDKWFSSYKDLNFLSFRLENPIHAPKISVFGGFHPQNLWAHRSDPKRHFRARNYAFWALIGPDLTYSATCGLGKKKPADSGKLAIRPDHTSQSLHATWPPVCTSIYQVLLKSVQ